MSEKFDQIVVAKFFANACDTHHNLIFCQNGLNFVDEDASYICDHCGEEIVVPIDFAAGANQEYVEDCPVCCSPNVIYVQIHDGDLRVWAEPE